MKTTVAEILRHKGKEVWSVSGDTMVYRALKLMQDKEIGAVIVLDEAGKVEGIVSERDYARKITLEGRSSKETSMREIMSKDLYAVAPGATVDECISVMTEKRVRHLPVFEHGQLAGLISIGDVVKAIVREQRIEIGFLNDYIMGKYV